MSKAASKYLKAVLAVTLISNAFLYVTTDLAAYLVVEELFPFHQILPLQETITPIEKNKLYSDFLLSDMSKVYVIEVLEEKRLLIFSFMIDAENATLKVNLEGPVERMQLSLAYHPTPYIYYVLRRGEVRIVITNPERGTAYYRFFVDISEPLGDNNSKILLLNGSRVAFHVDLRRDDGVSLNLNNSTYLHPRIRVFTLCYEVMGRESSYMLCFYGESLDKTLYFTADLGGRYYVLVESVKGEETVSLKSIITPPPWNQDWFWLTFNIAFITAITLFFITKIKRTKNLEKAALYVLIGYYFGFITIGLSASLIGSFNYGVPIFLLLFYLSILFYGLSLGIQIYANYLDRKETIRICPYCGKKVDLTKDNYCCGKMVKSISSAWLLMPLSFSFLFFIIGYIIIERVLPQSIGASLWVGGFGSFIGGFIAWWINRTIYRKSWNFLATGSIFSFLSPLLIGFLIDILLQPHIVLEWPGKFIRMRIAPLILPLGITIMFTILAIGLCALIAFHIRKLK